MAADANARRDRPGPSVGRRARRRGRARRRSASWSTAGPASARPASARPRPPTPLDPAVPTGLYPLAYPAYDEDPRREPALRVTHADGTTSTRLHVDDVEHVAHGDGRAEHTVHLVDEAQPLGVALRFRTHEDEGVLEQWVEVTNRQAGADPAARWPRRRRLRSSPATPGSPTSAATGPRSGRPPPRPSPSGPRCSRRGAASARTSRCRRLPARSRRHQHRVRRDGPRRRPGVGRRPPLRLRAHGHAPAPRALRAQLRPGRPRARPGHDLPQPGDGVGVVRRGPRRAHPAPPPVDPPTRPARRRAPPADRGQQLGGHVVRLRRGPPRRPDGLQRRASAPSCSSSTTAGSASSTLATTTPPASATGRPIPGSCPAASSPSPGPPRRAACASASGSSPRWSTPARPCYASTPTGWSANRAAATGRSASSSCSTSSARRCSGSCSTPIDGILDAHPGITHLKWDANRGITEPGSPTLAPDRQGDLWVDSQHARWDVMAEVAERWPDVELMLCASGGGRSDLGTLRWFHELWLSDNTDPVTRVRMQWAATHGLPTAARRRPRDPLGRPAAPVRLHGGHERPLRLRPRPRRPRRCRARGLPTSGQRSTRTIRPLVAAGRPLAPGLTVRAQRRRLAYTSPSDGSSVVFCYQLDEGPVPDRLPLAHLDPNSDLPRQHRDDLVELVRPGDHIGRRHRLAAHRAADRDDPALRAARPRTHG